MNAACLPAGLSVKTAQLDQNH